MHLSATAGFVSLLIAGPATPAPPPARVPAAVPAAAAADFEPARALIRRLMAERRLPSVAVAVARDGRLAWEEAFGWADTERRVAATPATMYSLASISKPVTGAALMVLVQRGLVDLDRPVNEYLGDAPLTGPGAAAVTVRQVANHTAGLPLHYQFFYADRAPARPSMDEAIGRYGVVALPPGAGFTYSNLGYGVLERVIERVSGRPFEAFLRTELFGPLGLRRTALVTAPAGGDTVAVRYDREGRPIPWYDFDHRGASAVYASAADLARFGLFALGRHPRRGGPLRAAAREEMLRPTSRRFAAVTYGVGWATYEDDHGQRSQGHGGGMPGVATVLRVYPAAGVVVAVLVNMADNQAAGEIAAETAAVLIPAMRERLRAAAPPPAPAPPLPAAVAGEWHGTVHTWAGPVGLRLWLEGAGGRVRLGDGPDTTLMRVEWDGSRLSGAFAGRIATPDAARAPTLIQFELLPAEGGLRGAVSALARDRYALSSRAELRRGPSPADSVDVLLLNGRIVDGTGAAWFAGDLAIRGDRIARIAPAGLLAGVPARVRIDVRGRVVAPGFIDIQSHSRGGLTTGDGRLVSKITQGITTEILGEGWTNAPANHQSENASGDPPALREEFGRPDGFARWLAHMERRGVAVNVGSFVGGTTVRSYAMGTRQGAPTPAELDTMRAVVRRAMADGAFGVATALIYPPAAFASTEELIEVARAMAPSGGVYITHVRSEGDRLLESLDEAIAIGEAAGVPVEIYHLKAMGRRNWPAIPLAIRRIDSARARGVDVQADMYPYIATGTAWTACLPPWASADGRLFDNLRDPATRARIRAEMVAPRTDWENNCALSGPDGMVVAATARPENRAYAGRRLSEIAAMMRRPWADALLDLLVSEGQVGGAVYFMMSEENLELQMRQPWMKFGTDAPGIDPATAGGLTHPRTYGSFPRILGHYVRDRGVLGLEDAVRKLTSAVATRLAIPDRGLLREGFAADVVVFDPATVADRATFEDPHRLSVGVEQVFVNGVAVVRDGAVTGATPGRALRGPGARPRP